ncbi:MAG: hypothetical protein ABIS84_15100 [Arachnia sp.]
MNGAWFPTAAAAAVVGAGVLGTALRLGLDALLGDEMVALAAVNVVGWFVLGLLHGRYGVRVAHLVAFLLALGITSFTSWMTLLIHGIPNAGSVVVALVEVVIGVMFGGIGHLVTMRRGPDLI